MRRIVDWLEHRTGIESLIKHFLYEDIPASSGWKQIFGSVALFSFLLQVVTGILLAFNYAPTPGDSYNSVRYIVNELTGGELIRAMHHWGASLMICVVVLHMAQVYLWGAYHKPREATWMVGVFLLLLTLAFGLTGYLLPWDNRAYWGTKVTIEIIGQTPFAGPYLQKLVGAPDGQVGVVTFSRFYTAHVLLLPALTGLLIAIHLFLVRKHGVAPEPAETAPPKKFYPEQVFKDTMAIFAAFCLLMGLAIAAKVPLGRLADPTDTSYLPRPEWYFLFLFQLLKVFEGPLEILGSFILPNLAVVALFAIPFLDRGALQRVTRRTAAMGSLALAALLWGGLTLAAIKGDPPRNEFVKQLELAPAAWQELTPEELAGIGYYRKERCATCHKPDGEAGAPDLTRRNVQRTAAWLVDHFKRPQELVPGSSMPPIHLSDRQLNALAAFLLRLNEKNAEALEKAPSFAVEGAMIYQRQSCGNCHQVNNAGMNNGPSLNGLALRRSKEWVMGHFRDPQKFSPNTIMPPYRFNNRDMENVTNYLMLLPRL
ncbi:MAG: cytochrome b N-terminal domain-containing protein [Bryobacteraceae bacterium]|nr:cytochrome b N-terminal domain-containing protein [Bryobacteraceae bacterium]